MLERSLKKFLWTFFICENQFPSLHEVSLILKGTTIHFQVFYYYCCVKSKIFSSTSLTATCFLKETACLPSCVLNLCIKNVIILIMPLLLFQKSVNVKMHHWVDMFIFLFFFFLLSQLVRSSPFLPRVASTLRQKMASFQSLMDVEESDTSDPLPEQDSNTGGCIKTRDYLSGEVPSLPQD